MRSLLKKMFKFCFRKLFAMGQFVGLDILPRHYYSEIPDLRQLSNADSWRSPFSMLGVNGANCDQQMQFIAECCPPSMIENLKSSNIYTRAVKAHRVMGYGEIEADFLYAFITKKKPALIFQIGCGVATAIVLRAANDAGYSPDIVCVEPYPTEYLMTQEKLGSLQIIKNKVQDIGLEIIENLPNDVFFMVDSTHTLGPAGEVSRIILEMLPRLKPGALVHFHDIYFPYDYDRHLLDSVCFFQHESVLLHAFLVNNAQFRVLVSLSMLHYARPNEMLNYLPNYCPARNSDGLNDSSGHFPSATYLLVSN